MFMMMIYFKASLLSADVSFLLKKEQMEFCSKLHNICFWLWIEYTVTSSPLFALKICFFHVLEEIETLPLSSGQYDKVEGIIFF